MVVRRLSWLNVTGTSLLVFLICLVSMSCGGSSSNTTPQPAAITITPTTASLNLGDTVQATASPVNQSNQGIIATVIWVTSNPEVANPTPSGLICAGIWDAIAVTCTPNKSGVAQITATSGNVTSAAVTVYVHPQVSKISVTPLNAPPTGCEPRGEEENFQANAFSSDGTDISSLVGPVSWSVTDSAVGKVTTGPGSNQSHVVAQTPGLTHVFASISGLSSETIPFESCRIQSISLTTLLSNSTTMVLATPGNAGIRVNARDRIGGAPTNLVLNWNSTNPGTATVKDASVTAVNPGSAAISASCSPPNCNVNLAPVYSSNVVSAQVSGTQADLTLYVGSTDCGTISGCTSFLVPISTMKNTAGSPITLPATPNSLQFTPAGKSGFLGSAVGLIVLTPSNSNSISTQRKIVGKVLAASPDENLVAVSDTTSSPNTVRILNNSTGSVSPFVLSGVTAAAFSTDSTEAYLVSGSNLYIFSTQEALRVFPLSAPANDVAFLATGPFAFLAGGTASSVEVHNTCDNGVPASPNTSTIPVVGTPTIIAPLPNGNQMVAVSSPGIEEIDVSTTAAGCPPPITATGDVANFHDFGQGSFTAKQLLVSGDGKRVYVITDLPNILVFATGPSGSGSVSTISLDGGATPLSAALTPDGSSLYVGASDGMVHRIDTVSNLDAQQISVAPCSGTTTSCNPNLIALQP